MMLKIYSVYDSKAEAYLQPFFMQSRGAAIRAFGDAVNDVNHVFAKHSGDYTLFEIGEFSDESASILSYATPVSLGVAIEFVKSSS